GGGGGWGGGGGGGRERGGGVGQALGAAGSRAGTSRGVAYLRGVQRPRGGFALTDGPINAQSTAWAAQGLLAAGVSPASVRNGGGAAPPHPSSGHARGGHHPHPASGAHNPRWGGGRGLVGGGRRQLPPPPGARAGP